MQYNIAAVSNRDIQMLYHYRILRQPSGSVLSVYADSPSTSITLSSFRAVNEEFQCAVPVQAPEGKVPLIEFSGANEADWKSIQDLTTVDVSQDTLLFHASRNDFSGPVNAKVYWCSSQSHIDSILDNYAKWLNSLEDSIEALKEQIANLDFGGDSLRTPSGINNNLTKFQVTVENDVATIELVDSGYQIVSAVMSQAFFDPSQSELATMVKALDGNISIHISDNRTRHLDNFSGHKITITGTGTWYINNTLSEVQFSKFSGKVYAVNCPYLMTSGGKEDSCAFEVVRLHNSFFHAYGGTFFDIDLKMRSVFDYQAGHLKHISCVGPGCECYIGPSVQVWTRRTPEEVIPDPVFAYDDIMGVLCKNDGLIIKNGIEISFLGGQHDCQVAPTDLRLNTTFDLHVASAPDPPTPPTGSGTPIEEAVVVGNQFVDATVTWAKGTLPSNMRTVEFVAGLIANSKWESGGTTDNIPSGVDTGTSWGNIYHHATNAYGTFYGAWCMRYDSVATAWNENVSNARAVTDAVAAILNAAQGSTGTSWETMSAFLESWGGDVTAAGMAEVVAVMERYTVDFNLITDIGQAAAVAAGVGYSSTEVETEKRRNSADTAFSLLMGA